MAMCGVIGVVSPWFVRGNVIVVAMCGLTVVARGGDIGWCQWCTGVVFQGWCHNGGNVWYHNGSQEWRHRGCATSGQIGVTVVARGGVTVAAMCGITMVANGGDTVVVSQ